MQKNYYPSTNGCYFIIWVMVLNHCARHSNAGRNIKQIFIFSPSEVQDSFGKNLHFKNIQPWWLSGLSGCVCSIMHSSEDPGLNPARDKNIHAIFGSIFSPQCIFLSIVLSFSSSENTFLCIFRTLIN